MSATDTKRTREDVIEAIRGSGAIKTVVAQRLGITRQTLDNYLARWATVRAAFDQERAAFVDIAESVLQRNVRLALQKQQEGELADTSDAKWVLSRLGKDRGYSERQEVDLTSGGRPIPIREVIVELPVATDEPVADRE